MTKHEIVRVFYAWQSDLPNKTNRGAIKNSLKKVKSNFSKKGMEIYIDEATRDVPGSPQIPDKILEKIIKADVFVCDVSTIRNSYKNKQATPNPNVVFELGFAVSELGWDRVILIINKAYTKFSDLPFDFDHNRIMPYEFSVKSNTADLKFLIDDLINGVGLIIKTNPLRPAQQRGMNPAQLRRERDLKNLEWLLETIHIPTMDEFIEGIPNKFSYMAFFFHDEFNGITNSSLFHISDKKLSDVIRKLRDSWNTTLSHEHLYNYDKKTKYFSFYPPPNRALTKAEDKSIKEIESARKEMANSLKELQRIVRKDYVEIDPTAASQEAIKSYRLFHEN